VKLDLRDAMRYKLPSMRIQRLLAYLLLSLTLPSFGQALLETYPEICMFPLMLRTVEESSNFPLSVEEQKFLEFRKRVRHVESEILQEKNLRLTMDLKLVRFIFDSWYRQPNGRASMNQELSKIINGYADEILRMSFDSQLRHQHILVLQADTQNAFIRLYRGGQLVLRFEERARLPRI
jgi:hypothetical protein